MKYSAILILAIIAIVSGQFRFRPISNPFRSFRFPSFRRLPTRPRAPRVNSRPFAQTQTFTRPVSTSSSNVVTQPIISSGPSSSSVGESTRSNTGNALFEIQGPNQPAAPTSISGPPVVRAPVIQSAPATALNEIPAPDMTAVRQPAVPTVGSSDSGPNHQWQGRNYLVSWREGRNGFSHSSARSYCRGRGMRIISLDNIQKAQHFLDLVESDRAPYFWAGGRISSDKRTLTWENGRSEGISRGRFPWSTGGSRGPQPDGGFGSENCLAILNNVYNDRVKFHDVGCSHTKPTVCEQ